MKYLIDENINIEDHNKEYNNDQKNYEDIEYIKNVKNSLYVQKLKVVDKYNKSIENTARYGDIIYCKNNGEMFAAYADGKLEILNSMQI